jgi:hypothetical protein
MFNPKIPGCTTGKVGVLSILPGPNAIFLGDLNMQSRIATRLARPEDVERLRQVLFMLKET